MSVEDLARIDEGDVLAPAVRFYELVPDHVPLVELLGQPLEDRLGTKICSADGVVCVIGATGAGKSSLIATAVTSLTTEPDSVAPLAPGGRHFLPIRVPVAPNGDRAADPLSFGRIAIGEIERHATEFLTGDQRRRLEEASAHHIARRSGAAKLGFNFEIRPFPGISEKLAVELQSATQGLLRLGDDANIVLGGLDRLVTMLRGHRREPVLVVEDTDQWSRRPDGTDIADAFFARIVHALAREVDVCSVVAVQDVYARRPSFLAIRDLVDVIDLPWLPEPVAGLATLIGRRVEHYLGGPPNAARVLDERALNALAHDYSRHGSVRRTLRLLRDVIEGAGPNYPEQIDYDRLMAGMPED